MLNGFPEHPLGSLQSSLAPIAIDLLAQFVEEGCGHLILRRPFPWIKVNKQESLRRSLGLLQIHHHFLERRFTIAPRCLNAENHCLRRVVIPKGFPEGSDKPLSPEFVVLQSLP